MTKVKFNWEFKISEDQEDLIVLLNGGVNCMIEIKHETFHKHLADKFFEIMYHEQELGTKTIVSKMQTIVKACEIKGA